MSKHKTGKEKRARKKREQRKAYRQRRRIRQEAQEALNDQGGGSPQPEVKPADHSGDEAVE